MTIAAKCRPGNPDPGAAPRLLAGSARRILPAQFRHSEGPCCIDATLPRGSSGVAPTSVRKEAGNRPIHTVLYLPPVGTALRWFTGRGRERGNEQPSTLKATAGVPTHV